MFEVKSLNLAGFKELSKSLDQNNLDQKLSQCTTPEAMGELIDGLMHDLFAYKNWFDREEFNGYVQALRDRKAQINAKEKQAKKPATQKPTDSKKKPNFKKKPESTTK